MHTIGKQLKQTKINLKFIHTQIAGTGASRFLLFKKRQLSPNLFILLSSNSPCVRNLLFKFYHFKSIKKRYENVKVKKRQQNRYLNCAERRAVLPQWYENCFIVQLHTEQSLASSAFAIIRSYVKMLITERTTFEFKHIPRKKFKIQKMDEDSKRFSPENIGIISEL